MAAFVIGVVTTLIGGLVSLLPMSPFRNFEIAESMETGLGWLNWFIDIESCMIIFNTWLGLCIAAYVIDWIFTKGQKVAGAVTGS